MSELREPSSEPVPTPRSRSGAQRVLRRLRVEAPALASGGDDRPPSRVLEWLVGEIPLGATTLETGCGWSTVALAGVADRHVAVTPDRLALERIRAWGAAAEVDLVAVEAVAADPARHLPATVGTDALPCGSFDLVLVDGDHAAPLPALDCFFATPLLRPGGLLVLERTGIRAVAEVARRLRRDTDGWAVRHRVDDALVLQRRATGPATPTHWWEQPGNVETPTLEGRARSLRARLVGGAR